MTNAFYPSGSAPRCCLGGALKVVIQISSVNSGSVSRKLTTTALNNEIYLKVLAITSSFTGGTELLLDCKSHLEASVWQLVMKEYVTQCVTHGWVLLCFVTIIMMHESVDTQIHWIIERSSHCWFGSFQLCWLKKIDTISAMIQSLCEVLFKSHESILPKLCVASHLHVELPNEEPCTLIKSTVLLTWGVEKGRPWMLHSPRPRWPQNEPLRRTMWLWREGNAQITALLFGYWVVPLGRCSPAGLPTIIKALMHIPAYSTAVNDVFSFPQLLCLLISFVLPFLILLRLSL